MPKKKAPKLAQWFSNCGSWGDHHDLTVLKAGLAAGYLDEQDEYGMTALSFAVMSQWMEGIEALLKSGADTELRHYRTGSTPLQMAVSYNLDDAAILLLLGAGANPDSPNHFGNTPREHASLSGCDRFFTHIPIQSLPLPTPRIQNAEDLASHYYPRFKIPAREERESMKVGQAVDLYVYGPKSKVKQDTVKVRITRRSGRRPKVSYTAQVETPIEQTNLLPGTTDVEFGPENIASVYLPRPTKKPVTKSATKAKRPK